MNYLKKIFKIFLILLFASSIIILVVKIIQKRKESVSFLTVDYDYIVVTQDDQIKFSLPVYTNEENSFYLNNTLIKKARIKNDKEDEFYDCLVDFEKTDSVIDYKEEKYYLYKANVSLNFTFNEPTFIKKAMLEFNYTTDTLINLPIGSVSFYNGDNASHLNYTNLLGFTQKNGNKTVLAGVQIKLNPEERVVINRVISLSADVLVDEYLTKVLSLKESYQFPTDYELFDCSNRTKKVIIDKESEVILFLKYTSLKEVNEIGFIIEYEIGNEQYRKIVYPFKYFYSGNPYTILETTI